MIMEKPHSIGLYHARGACVEIRTCDRSVVEFPQAQLQFESREDPSFCSQRI